MFEVVLLVTTLLCALVAGLLFAFAVVAMPGINALSDAEFIRSFQVMDGVIQRNQPLFMLAWVGSVVGVIVTTVFGLFELEGEELALLVAAASIYLIGVQAPTISVNIPLNNRVQRVEVAGASERHLAHEREAFEPRWNRWNRVRTLFAVAVVLLLLILILQL